MTKCEGWWKLVKCAAHNEAPMNSLPASAFRLLYKGFVMAGTAVSDENMKTEYWKVVSMLNILKFQTLVTCQKGLDKQDRPRSDCF